MKKNLRQTMRTLRNSLPEDYREKASISICKQLRSLPEYRDAERVGLYAAHQSEVDLSDIVKTATLEGKTCFFPVILENQTLTFLPISPNQDWRVNRYGIAEPVGTRENAIPINQLDLLILPLIAFDDQGNRLGSGAGFYDRTLAHEKPGCLIGVAFECQHQPSIPVDDWDIPLSLIITEKTLYRTQL